MRVFRSRARYVALETNCNLESSKRPLLPLVGWKTHRVSVMATQEIVWNNEKKVTSAAIEVEELAKDDCFYTQPTRLSALQVARFSIEFEDPQHPFTAVSSTGRRRSSGNNINTVRSS
ncbi:uncharacterized protein PHALS_09100 [Plasmopara halstedii]|uniref:Uncharacterized protein n=1 Tax=Plasmopara halstedii TaxID=4781 RepID=A0A0N7L4L8_PLAHL|nr:uncharacterized protein PHALS_09100 [Plasmopara halstedii]CEG39035.1 hypothetical protein PHALS_09100 [Plasmopara halstedii]|eukprot:XP_024575404.1 hypothetical protein PHALS_09100 [Plasmopara halstedii]